MDRIDQMVRALYRVTAKDREALLAGFDSLVLTEILHRHARTTLDYETVWPGVWGEMLGRERASNLHDAEMCAAEGRCSSCLADVEPVDIETGLCPTCTGGFARARRGGRR